MDDDWNDEQIHNNTYNDPDDPDSAGVHLAQDRLYVRHIPPDLTEKGLERAFAKFGTVIQAYLSLDSAKPYGLISMQTPADAQNAMTHLNGTPPLHLIVTLAKAKSDKAIKRQRQDSRQPRDGGAARLRDGYQSRGDGRQLRGDGHQSRGDAYQSRGDAYQSRGDATCKTPPRAAPEPLPRVVPELQLVVQSARHSVAASTTSSGQDWQRSMLHGDYYEEEEYVDEEYEEYGELDEEVDVELAIKRLQILDLQRSYELTRIKRLSGRRNVFGGERYVTTDHKVVVKNPAAASGGGGGGVVPSPVAENVQRKIPAEMLNPEQHRQLVLRRPYSAAKWNESVDREAEEPCPDGELPPLMGALQCVVCARPALTFCSGCTVTPYCSTGCQRRDWQSRHRTVCHNLAAHREAQAPAAAAAAVGGAARPSRSLTRGGGGDEVEGQPSGARPRLNGVDTTDKTPAPKFTGYPNRTGYKKPEFRQANSRQENHQSGERQPDNRQPHNRQSDNHQPNYRRADHEQHNDRQHDSASRPPFKKFGNDASPRDSGKDSGVEGSFRKQSSGGNFERRRPPLRSDAVRQDHSEPTGAESKPEPRAGPSIEQRVARVPEVPAETVPKAPAAHVPKARADPPREKELPEHYIPELVACGGVMTVMVGDPEAGRVLCVAMDEAHSEQYRLLCEELGAVCDADPSELVPSPGSLLCVLDVADGGWYRARCLRAGAGGEVALLDGARVMRLEGAACRRVPPAYVDTPEFACTLECAAPVKDGDMIFCTVTSKQSDVVSVSVTSSDGAALGSGEITRWRPPVCAPPPAPPATKPAVISSRIPAKLLELREEQLGQEAKFAKESAVRAAEPTRARAPVAKEVPESHVAGALAAGGQLLLSVERRGAAPGVGSAAALCLAMTAERADDYERLCGALAEACEADTADYVPSAGSLLCVLDPTDGGWYRARCLRAGGEAALLDSPRVMPLDGVTCRRVPDAYVDIPEFMCVMESEQPVQVGQSYQGVVLSNSGDVVSVMLTAAEGDEPSGEARLTRWRPPLETTTQPPLETATKEQPSIKSVATERPTVKTASPKTSGSPPAAAGAASSPMSGPGGNAESFERPPLSARSEVLLVHAAALDGVYVRPARRDATVDFDGVLKDVLLYGLEVEKEPLTTPQSVGTLVVAQFEDGLYYRAVIRRTKQDQNKYLLEYLDFGNIEKTTLDKLRACPAKLGPAVRPVLTSQVRLHEVTSLSEEAIGYLKKIKEEEVVLTLTLPGGEREAPSGAAAVLTCAETREQLNAKLQEMSTPDWKKMEDKGQSVIESAVLPVQEMGMVELPAAGGELRVLSTDMISNGLLFACAADDPTLDYVNNHLPAELAAYCESAIGREPYLPRPNELCIASFPDHGGAWCRAVAVEQVGGPGGSHLRLMCQDHGCMEQVAAADVRKMLAEFVRRPGLACMLEIKDFPKSLSAEEERRALRALAGGTMRARRCVRQSDGEYLVEAPELLAALLADR